MRHAHALWEGLALAQLRGPSWYLIQFTAAQLFPMMGSTFHPNLHINIHTAQAHRHC